MRRSKDDNEEISRTIAQLKEIQEKATSISNFLIENNEPDCKRKYLILGSSTIINRSTISISNAVNSIFYRIFITSINL